MNSCKRFFHRRLQLPKVRARIIQTVDVINTETSHASFLEKTKHQAVKGLEDHRVLHPDGDEFIDVEEAPVVDLLGSDPPEGQAIGLVI